MSQKHTSGPWRTNAGDETRVMAGNALMARAECGGITGITLAEAEANACLIATAPDLLANLTFAVKLLSALPGFGGTAQVDAMRAAIAKAQGDI